MLCTLRQTAEWLKKILPLPPHSPPLKFSDYFLFTFNNHADGQTDSGNDGQGWGRIYESHAIYVDSQAQG